MSFKCNPLRKTTLGQSMVEYALILIAIALVSMGALGNIGQNLNITFNNTATAIGPAGGATNNGSGGGSGNNGSGSATNPVTPSEAQQIMDSAAEIGIENSGNEETTGASAQEQFNNTNPVPEIAAASPAMADGNGNIFAGGVSTTGTMGCQSSGSGGTCSTNNSQRLTGP